MSFYVNLGFERLAFVAVTLLLHADWMMVKNASNQHGANSVTVALRGILVAKSLGLIQCWS